MAGGFSLSGLFHPLRKWWAIRRIVRKLPRRLREDYGRLSAYMPAQVETTINRHRIVSPEFAPYAVAIFCDPKELKELGLQRNIDFEALRHEAWDFVRSGPITGDEAFREADEHGHGQGWSGHSETGGGHSHGDGGGHH